jgi:hypothetical protein
MAGSSPVPGMRHQRRAYLPGRQLYGPWQHQSPEPPSKRPTGTDTDGIDGIDGIAGTDGTDGITGIDGIIGIRTAITIGARDTTIGSGPRQKTTRIKKPAQTAGFPPMIQCQ